MRLRIVMLMFGLAVAAAAPEAAPAAPAARVVEVDLEADLGGASLRQVEIIRTLIQAARIMDELHREQVEGEGFYPADMSAAEFEAWRDPGARSPYTVVRRDPFGALEAVPYHQAWPRELGRVARLLAQAAALSNDESLRSYLTLRARALITGDYRRAEAAWQAMRYSDLDVLIGPIFKDADQRFGLKAGFGAYLMMRDWAWGARLAGFTVYLPQIQQSLPVSAAFKAEIPDVGMKVAVYDLLFHAGSGAARADAVTPEELGESRLRLRQGPQRLQLRNVTQARFRELVLPAADALLVPRQRSLVRFDAFFLNTMFHEMAHSLGMRETVNGRGPVVDALAEYADVIEEAKAAVLSLWLVDWLHAEDELPETELQEHYASVLAGLLRAVHIDAGSAIGQAQVLLFNHFRDHGAVRRDAATGRYYFDPEQMQTAIETLAAHVLTLQGSGDYEGAASLVATMGNPRPELRSDLARLAASGVPAAVVFRQGENLLGL
jgi:hypothetical protein